MIFETLINLCTIIVRGMLGTLPMGISNLLIDMWEVGEGRTVNWGFGLISYSTDWLDTIISVMRSWDSFLPVREVFAMLLIASSFIGALIAVKVVKYIANMIRGAGA